MPVVPATFCEIVGKAEEKENIDLGQRWPGGGELSHRNRPVHWLRLSRRQRACCHQACTILGRLLCAWPTARLPYFLHFHFRHVDAI